MAQYRKTFFNLAGGPGERITDPGEIQANEQRRMAMQQQQLAMQQASQQQAQMQAQQEMALKWAMGQEAQKMDQARMQQQQGQFDAQQAGYGDMRAHESEMLERRGQQRMSLEEMLQGGRRDLKQMGLDAGTKEAQAERDLRETLKAMGLASTEREGQAGRTSREGIASLAELGRQGRHETVSGSTAAQILAGDAREGRTVERQRLAAEAQRRAGEAAQREKVKILRAEKISEWLPVISEIGKLGVGEHAKRDELITLLMGQAGALSEIDPGIEEALKRLLKPAVSKGAASEKSFRRAVDEFVYEDLGVPEISKPGGVGWEERNKAAENREYWDTMDPEVKRLLGIGMQDAPVFQSRFGPSGPERLR